MPPGKRGSAKKKKKKSKASISSNATRPPPHGESDGGEYSSSKSQQSSPHLVVKAEKKDDNSSGNQSLTIDRTEEAAKETQSKIEIDRGSNSRKSYEKREDNSSGNQSLTIDRNEDAANKTQSECEINRGSNSQKSHEKSSSSRSSSSNDKSHVDKKKAMVIQPAAVADLVQLAKEAPNAIEINRGSNSHNSLEKSLSSRSSSSNDKSHVDKKKAMVIQPAAVADLVQLAKEAPNAIEINRGSNSHNSLEKSLSSRSSSSNDKSHVDKKKAMVIQPAAVADLVQLAKEAPNAIEINRGSNSHNSLEKSLSSRSSSSNDKSHVDKKKAMVIQPAAVADLVQLAKEAPNAIEINRGSNSHNSLEKSLSSRSSSSNDKSHVDKKKAMVIQPAAVADLVQLAKEAPNAIEINRGSNSHNSLEKSLSSRSSSSNDKSHVDKKKAMVIQPAAVADLVQLAKEAQSAIEINRGGSNSHNSLEKSSSSRSSSSNDKSHFDKKKAVVIQPAAAVADLVQPIESVADLVQPIESLSENGSCRLGDLAVTGSPIVDPAKPVSSLVELASQVFDNTKLQEKDDLVVAETPLEQNNCPTSTSEVVGSVPKESEVEKLVSLDDKASKKSDDCLPASTNGACSFCGRNTTDSVNESKTPECSEKQPLLGSAPRPAEKTSWKSCCGIFELCSGSSR